MTKSFAIVIENNLEELQSPLSAEYKAGMSEFYKNKDEFSQKIS